MRSRQRDSSRVDCIACGASVKRADAREYDRYGDRWDRSNKRFEFLCKPCHRDESHHPRNGLEEILTVIGATHASPQAFVREYYQVVQDSDPD